MEERNGLSPISIYVDSPDELIKGTEDFFHPPKRDLRYNPKNGNTTNPYDNSDFEEDADASHTCAIIPAFVKNIQSLDLDKNRDNEIIDSADADENHDSSKIDIEKCFDERC